MPVARPATHPQGQRRVVGVALVALAAGCGFSGEGTLVADSSPAPPGGPSTSHAASSGGGTDGGASADASSPAPPCTDPALAFDGKDDVVTVPDDNALDLGSDFTVEAWIKPDASAVAVGAEMDLVSHHDPGASKGWALALVSGHIEIGVWGSATFVAESTVAGAAGGSYVAGGRWAHVAGTLQGSTLRVYYDGVLRDTASVGGFLFGRDAYAGPVRIGGAASSGGARFAGIIDDVRLSRSARYTGGTAPRPTAALAVDNATVAAWRFDELGGSTLVDDTGAHDGTFAPDGTAPMRILTTCIADR